MSQVHFSLSCCLVGDTRKGQSYSRGVGGLRLTLKAYRDGFNMTKHHQRPSRDDIISGNDNCAMHIVMIIQADFPLECMSYAQSKFDEKMFFEGRVDPKRHYGIFQR